MTRLFTCGYETGDVNEAGVTTIGTNAALTVVSSTPTARSGTYCLKASTSGTSLGPTYKSVAFTAAKTEIWVRFALFVHHTTAVQNYQVLTLLDGAGAAQTSLAYNSSDGLIRLYRGVATGTLLGTASGSFALDQWHVIEWRTQILTTTTGTSEVWLDGTQVITYSGDNSQTTTLNVLTAQFGVGATATSTVAGCYVAYDDLAINDVAGSINNGRAGDGRIVLLVPGGVGSSAVLARGGTDSGANWSQTSELPPSMTQYVASANPTDRDLYAMSDLGVAVASINVVEELVLAQNSDAGAGSLGLTIKSGATTNEATAQTLGTSAIYYTARWETDPNTSAAWTSTAVNALEAGVTVR